MGFPILVRWHLYIESGPWFSIWYLTPVSYGITFLFLLDDPNTAVHLKTMTCYLNMYSFGMWHPYQTPTLRFPVIITFNVHCYMCISDKLQLSNKRPADREIRVLIGCVFHPYSRVKIQLYPQEVKPLFPKQQLLFRCIIWFQLNCVTLPSLSVNHHQTIPLLLLQ